MELFDQPFLLLDVSERKTRDGRPYILFSLGDKTGKVGGVFWNVPSDVLQECPTGSVVLVTGDVRLYNKRPQVVALDLQSFEPDSMACYVPSSQRDRDEMIDELRQVIDELREPLRQLVMDILLDPLFVRRYAEAPAARLMHHACVGGLLEHSLAMVPFCRLASERYSAVDRDLLIAGALLHDVGKVSAYRTEATFPVTDDSRLVGHLTRGAIQVETAARKIPGFPDGLCRELVHMVVSSHRVPEWGSPVPPRTLEAVLLHQIDMLESRAQGYLDHVSSEPGDAPWTSPSAMFGYELKRTEQGRSKTRTAPDPTSPDS